MRFVADLILAPTVVGACCARECQYIGEARYLRVSHTMQPIRIIRFRLRTVTSWTMLAGPRDEVDESNVPFSKWGFNCVWITHRIVALNRKRSGMAQVTGSDDALARWS